MGGSGDSQEDWLSASLRDVPTPDGLLARLARNILLGDDEIDARLKAAPVPPDWRERLEQIAAPPRLRWKVSSLTTAACILVGTVGYVAAAVTLITLSGFPGRRAEASVFDLRDGAILGSFAALDEEDPTVRIEPSVLLDPEPLLELAESTEPTRPTAEVREEIIYGWDLRAPRAARRGVAITAPAPSGLWGPVLNAVAMSEGAGSVLGSAAVDRDDSLPDLWRVARRAKQGIKPPLEPGYNLPFQLQFHQHPIVALDHPNPALRTVQAPLWSDSFSVDRALRLLQRGEVPGPDEVRIEDFLAAVPYEFVAPTDAAVGLTAAGAPTPFGDAALPLALQIGVQAKVLSGEKRDGCRLTVAVDRSGSMQRGGTFDLVRRALHGLIRRLGPNDQLSLVMFDAQAEVTFENARAVDAFDLHRAVERLQPGRTTNVVSGLQTAFGSALSHPSDDGLRHRVVLVTDGLAPLPTQVRDRVLAAVAAGASDGATLSVVQVGEPSSPSDSLMAELAEAGSGGLKRAATADQVEWALAEILSDRSQVVAEQVKLSIEFNPQRVQFYRFVGHEASDAKLDGGPVEFSLSAGQSCAALFELRLRPIPEPRPGQAAPKLGPIAVARLTWRDPGGESDRHRDLKIDDGAFVNSLDVAPSWLQRSLIAAEIAEVLRKSAFAQGSSVDAAMHAASPYEALRPSGDGFERVLEVARLLRQLNSAPTRRDGDKR
ncbi:MAG TPA: YfbK domain-containing protein [Pirellulales bacterium]